MDSVGPNIYRRYLKHTEMLEALEALADVRPGWMRLEVLTQTPEGRSLVAVSVTDPRTGPAQDKPAFYLDANIHARELPGGAVAMRLLHHLIHSADMPEVAQLLAGTTFYVIPRVAVDGVEALLEGRSLVRSAPRPWPDEHPPEGLVPRDLDGDGYVREMRIPDPSGGWMPHPRDSRLMIPRPFDATDGEFYRVMVEGVFEGGDPRLLQAAREPNGLDFNRNFPAFWKVESEQKGAGPHPLSEPETLALARFVTAHPNICCAQALHSGIEVVIPPEGVTPYDRFPEADKAFFEALGARGEALLGMPMASIMRHGYPECAGDFCEWAYAHRGIAGMVVELWSLPGRAGISLQDHLAAWSTRPHTWSDIELACLSWASEHLEPGAFLPWHPMEHPQLGRVEVGGWRRGLWHAPPPGALLDELTEKALAFVLSHAAAVPRLSTVQVTQRALAPDLFAVSVVVENCGHLPTYITQKGKSQDLVKGPSAYIQLPEGASLELGQPRVALGHLKGRGQRAAVDWLVRAPAGSLVELEVTSPSAGRLRHCVELGAQPC